MSKTINYGIDLGTTNSSIALYDGNEVRVFKNRDLMDITSSAVRIEKTGRIIVGHRAYQSLFSDADNVAAEFKRWIGQSDRKHFKAADKMLTAEELSAEILKSLLDDARRQTTDLVKAAVITVPAAFGQLQCEATARAAALAGLAEAPLLQEPLAAAIAYGMKPGAKNKRWLVYDLGGGTFDIAIVSTHEGQLTILEHRGDNMLGGKDFDRLILERILWPRLQESSNLPDFGQQTTKHQKLLSVIRGKAEEVKIDLSLSQRATVSIFNVGEDDEGNTMEVEFEITREELNQLIEPYIVKTIELCRKAIEGAHITGEDISTIILVGGPTQTPLLREMITQELGITLEFTIDPMTVVARGAAVYGSTIQLKKASVKPTKPQALPINLAHEPVCSETSCLVAGRIETMPQNVDQIEIRIEAETGHWTSGWLPIQKGYFEAKVHLLENKTNKFFIYLRDGRGNELTPDPESLSIRQGLTLAEPPLPHTIGAEVVRADGKSEIDVIFPRSTPLPTQKTITYKASKTLRPGKEGDCLPIKIWEGEFQDPESNTWVGPLKIYDSEINRPIPEGADIEVTIAIDASRRMDVQAYVPLLKQHFANSVYVPEESEQKIVEEAKKIPSEIDAYYSQAEKIKEAIQEVDDPTIQNEFNKVKTDLDALFVDQNSLESQGTSNPDDAKQLNKRSKDIRGRLHEIQNQIEAQATSLRGLLPRVENTRAETEEVVTKWGESLEKKEFELLSREAERQSQREDEKSLDKIISEFEGLKWRILFKQDWFWKEWFDYLARPGVPFINSGEAQRLIKIGHEAVSKGDGDGLRAVVNNLWKLQRKEEVEIGKEMAMKAGITRKQK